MRSGLRLAPLLVLAGLAGCTGGEPDVPDPADLAEGPDLEMLQDTWVVQMADDAERASYDSNQGWRIWQGIGVTG